MPRAGDLILLLGIGIVLLAIGLLLHPLLDTVAGRLDWLLEHQSTPFLIASSTCLGLLVLWRIWERRALSHQNALSRAKQEQRHHLGEISRQASDAILLFDEERRIIDANNKALEIFGYTKDELLGLRTDQLRADDFKSQTEEDFNQVHSGKRNLFEFSCRSRQGRLFPVEVSATPVSAGDRTYILAIIRDITRRRAHEIEIARLNRMLELVGHIDHALVHVSSRQDLFDKICSSLLDSGLFRGSWIGWLEKSSSRILPVAVSGADLALFSRMIVSADPLMPEGRGPSGTALRDNKTVVCNDLMNTDTMNPWLELAKAHGVKASIALPIRVGGAALGVLTVYGIEVDFFGEREVRLLEEVAADLSFALEVVSVREEQRVANESLRTTVARLARAEDMARLGHWDHDLRSGTINCSPGIHRIFEIHTGVFANNYETFMQLVHPEDRDRVDRVYKDSVASHSHYFVPHRLLMPDGRILFVEQSGTHYYDSDGTPIHTEGTTQDVTDRMRSDLRLVELVRKLRVLHQVSQLLEQPGLTDANIIEEVIRLLPSAISAPSRARVVITVNDQAWQAGPEGLVASHVEAGVFIAGRQVGLLTLDYIQTGREAAQGLAFNEEEKSTVEQVAKTLGLGLTARESLRALQSFNQQLELKITQRTAELASINGEINALLTAIPDLLLRLNTSGDVLNLKQAKESDSLARLLSADNQLPEQLFQASLGLGEACLSTGQTLSRELSHPVGDTMLEIELRAAPLRAKEFIVLFRDITARRHLEEENAAILERERQLSDMKSRFISVTSHEFRTPLSAASAAVELLRNHADQLSPAKRAELLERIQASHRRIAEMLEDVLTLHRAEAGRLQPVFCEIDLRIQLEIIVEESRLADKGQHDISLECDDGNALTHTDPALLQHIVGNLISNATRYSPPHSEILIRLGLEENGFVCCVEDEGIGIPPAELERIFEPFERASNVGSIQGTGLGLNIVRRMAEALGGEVRAENRPVRGARFTFLCPRHLRTEHAPLHESSNH